MNLTMLSTCFVYFRASGEMYETMPICCNVKKSPNLLALIKGTPLPPGNVTRQH